MSISGGGYFTLTTDFINVTAGVITPSGTFNLAPGPAFIPFDYSPQSRSVMSGQSVTLSVTAVGQAPLSYQWYRGGSGDTSNPVAGATSSDYTTPPVVVAASYWVRVSNTLGSMNSQTANISVAGAGTGAISGTITSATQPVANATVSIFSASEQFIVAAARTSSTGAFAVGGLLPGNYYAFASYGAVSGNVSGSTVAPAEYPYADVLYPNIPCAGVQNVGTYCRTNSGTPITVTAGGVTTGIDFDLPIGGAITGSLTINGQIPGPSGAAQVGLLVDSVSPSRFGHVDPLGVLVLPRLPAGTYRVTAAAAGMTSEVWDDTPCPAFNCLTAGGTPIVVPPAGTVTGKNFDLAPAPPPPLVVTQPQPQSIAGGQSATLSVTPGGTGPFFYQWYRGSSGNTFDPIAGATSSTYNTGPLGRGAHDFWVRVSNYGGIANSAAATVSVNLGGYRLGPGGGGGGITGGTIGPIPLGGPRPQRPSGPGR